ncbi:MAG: DUF393 domain-containing protein [Bacteroidetes bacterium]|nr:DUF393 domain-containing protein [Bacteroidota bacterium]
MFEVKVVLFDGVCNLCNGYVNWVIDHDKSRQVKFASLQSGYGQAVIERFNIHDQYLNTIIYLDGDKIYFRSEAVLRTLKQMGGIYSLAFGFMIIPAFLRNWVYNTVAKYRYRWFGEREVCRIPTPELKDRFVE